jgi:N4-gp56 family major capsid protein
MASTSYGTNSASAVKLFSRKLFREALKQTTMSKYMGEGSDNMIQVLNDTRKGPGDKITYQLRMQLTGNGVQGDGVLEGSEEALTVYTDNILIDQLRHAVRSGGKMSDQRIPFEVREEARMGLTDWWADRIDTSLINVLAGNSGQTDTRFTGNNAATAPSTGRQLFINANELTEASVSTTSTLTLAGIDKCVATAKVATPLIRPLMVNGSPHYVMHIHPFQVYSLRTNTNTGQWLDIQKAAMTGGKIGDNPIFTGALGVYNNVILVENPRVPAVVANTRRAVFCGAQAATFAVGQNSAPEKMSWVEELFDYENQLGVSAGMIFGTKKSVFNSVDFGTLVLTTYATAP